MHVDGYNYVRFGFGKVSPGQHTVRRCSFCVRWIESRVQEGEKVIIVQTFGLNGTNEWVKHWWVKRMEISRVQTHADFVRL